MKTIRITAIRKADYKESAEKYENPIEHKCRIREGQILICQQAKNGRTVRQSLEKHEAICHGIGARWRKFP